MQRPLLSTILFATVFAFIVGCSNSSEAGESKKEDAIAGNVLGDGAAAARKDISDGKIQLMEAGTQELYTPGVPFNDKRFKDIPRKKLPSGCTNPQALDAIRYAEEYNAVVVKHVLSLSHRE